jgi:hypothetical protein
MHFDALPPWSRRRRQRDETMSKLLFHDDGQSVTFAAKVVPGSSRTALAGLLEDAVKIRVAAPPEKGKANQCLTAFLAKQLGVKKNAVRVVAGQNGPVKQIRVEGISGYGLVERLGFRTQGR